MHVSFEKWNLGIIIALGGIVCLPHSYVKILAPVPQNVTLLGIVSLQDVVKMRSYWSRIGP